MTVAYIRISLLRARRFSSSYTEQIDCIQNVNTWKISVSRNHVGNLLLFTMSCMSSYKTIISSPFASHDSSQCSIQIDIKLNETHKFLDLAQVMLKPIFRRGISNDNTWISSLAV